MAANPFLLQEGGNPFTFTPQQQQQGTPNPGFPLSLLGPGPPGGTVSAGLQNSLDNFLTQYVNPYRPQWLSTGISLILFSAGMLWLAGTQWANAAGWFLLVVVVWQLIAAIKNPQGKAIFLRTAGASNNLI